MAEKKKSGLLWFLPMAVVYVAGLILAVRYDLVIDQALYTPASLPAILMECFGWYPAFVWTVGLVLLVGAKPGELRRGPWVAPVAYAMAVAGTVLIWFNSMKDWLKRGMAGSYTDIGPLLILGLLLIILVCVLLFYRGLSVKKWWALLFASAFGTVLLAVDEVVINLLKTVWARTRFDDMVRAGEGFGLFTPWYQPFGNGGSSFPSGHTANAAFILVLVVLCDVLPRWNKNRKLVYVVCWAYIAFMGFTRMWIGRHYLSDTLAGSAVMAALVFAMRHNKWYRKALGYVKGRMGKKGKA